MHEHEKPGACVSVHELERPGGREGDERGGEGERNQLGPHTERVRGLQKEGVRIPDSDIEGEYKESGRENHTKDKHHRSSRLAIQAKYYQRERKREGGCQRRVRGRTRERREGGMLTEVDREKKQKRRGYMESRRENRERQR